MRRLKIYAKELRNGDLVITDPQVDSSLRFRVSDVWVDRDSDSDEPVVTFRVGVNPGTIMTIHADWALTVDRPLPVIVLPGEVVGMLGPIINPDAWEVPENRRVAEEVSAAIDAWHRELRHG